MRYTYTCPFSLALSILSVVTSFVASPFFSILTYLPSVCVSILLYLASFCPVKTAIPLFCMYAYSTTLFLSLRVYIHRPILQHLCLVLTYYPIPSCLSTLFCSA